MIWGMMAFKGVKAVPRLNPKGPKPLLPWQLHCLFRCLVPPPSPPSRGPSTRPLRNQGAKLGGSERTNRKLHNRISRQCLRFLVQHSGYSRFCQECAEVLYFVDDDAMTGGNSSSSFRKFPHCLAGTWTYQNLHFLQCA